MQSAQELLDHRGGEEVNKKTRDNKRIRQVTVPGLACECGVRELQSRCHKVVRQD